ncbi:hypothetical protein ILUMI_17385 [Ignelater luminosus]|uniref:HAT C-terminal dimerisation domain-containing protein n=1 Tax=Ignelater luminosus TaxID=2038154 RepID=A0A8K0CJZ2_IGNLU|nr:hypothetical protein ILUMI_17385 [Ignelater luminosus]
MKRTSGLLEKFLDSSSASTSSKSSFCSDKENVAAELALTYHTVKHNLSYNSTIKLNKIIYVNSSTATGIRLAKTKMEALITEVLGPYAIQNVIDDINTKNLFYCLQTDAFNKKNIKLFALVIQYFMAKNGIQNKLLDFYENSNESADGMFEAIQKQLSKAVKCLEGNCITILDVYGIMVNIRDGLAQRKQDLFYGYETGKKTKLLSSPELTREIHTNFLLFIDKALEYLNKWFDFNDTNWLFPLGNINLKSNVEFDNIVNIIENLNLQKLNINMDDLYGEIALLNKPYDQIYSSEGFAELFTAQKWQQVFNKTDYNFSNLYKVISFLLSIPVTSAFTEIVFSVMNSKWRDETNKASLNRKK